MRIQDVVCVPVRSGFYRDDQAAIRAGAGHDGWLYAGAPLTPGFRAIREPGEAVSVLLVLDDGQVAVGDCAEVQYSGAGGRAPVFSSAEAVNVIARLAPVLTSAEWTDFRSAAEHIDRYVADGDRLAPAVRYGVTQALLHARSLDQGLTMAEVVREEYSTGAELVPVPIYAQTGDDRYTNVDKMIMKEVDVLPHGLINHVATKLGANGELLRDYVSWLSRRILAVRSSPAYSPRLHIDTYGTIGLAFGTDLQRVADYLALLSECAAPFKLSVEHPIDAGSRDAQVEVYAALRAVLRAKGVPVDLVVDEWCNTLEDIEAFVAAAAADVIHVKMPDLGGVNNTIEALLHVKRNGLAAYCGGTCNETDVSGRVSAHVAMACDADQVLAKPGMGVDEGLMVVGNEMARVAALARSRTQSRPGSPSERAT
ncbi:methylaspartate ammonia-lyase [Nocardioides allogilvus]|uniref:methylaspartate ammonia-lyase n=1 Tax=Nocardioides allogilvus TaxID=2072017 RepID=UPI000D328096|nr:methylaspartate ammonia-lyase [Nocardioides allogilvus]